MNKTISLAVGSINTQLLNDNRPEPLVKVSPLSLVTNTISDTSDIKLVAELETTEFDENQENLITIFLASEMEEC